MTVTVDEIAKWRDPILKIIFRHLSGEDCVVFLFGSFAQGESVRGSDIDIGIISSGPLSPGAFLALQEEIDTELPILRKVDLVDFNSVDRQVREEALKEIQIWHIGKKCGDLSKSLKLPRKN